MKSSESFIPPRTSSIRVHHSTRQGEGRHQHRVRKVGIGLHCHCCYPRRSSLCGRSCILPCPVTGMSFLQSVDSECIQDGSEGEQYYVFVVRRSYSTRPIMMHVWFGSLFESSVHWTKASRWKMAGGLDVVFPFHAAVSASSIASHRTVSKSVSSWP